MALHAPDSGGGRTLLRKTHSLLRAGGMILAIPFLILGAAASALAQDPSGPAIPPAPTLPPPSAAVPPATGTPMAANREAELEERIRQLEGMVNKLATQVNKLSPPATPASATAGGTSGGTAPNPDGGGTPTATGTGGAAPSATGGASAPGQSLPPNPPSSKRFNSPATLESKKATARFGPGFEIRTEDDEFIFQFHNLTQFDYRGYQQGGQDPVHDTFTFPRQWFMFSGRITKPFGYFVSLANGFDTFSILDVFVDYDYDPKLRIRAGRFKTPFTYEFLVEPVQGLIIPERSLFFNNFAQNRDLGVMAYGRILNNQVDYAVGLFNGTRNGFVDSNDAKNVSAFLNWKPFGDEENTLFENLNIGGSVFAGRRNNLPAPNVLRTIVPIAGNAVAGTPFLAFNADAREVGYQAFWDLHIAYFYKQLAVIAEWGSGFQNYAPSSQVGNKTKIPVQSFYVEAGYLLTGETRSSVGIVKPNRPFDLRKGKFGPGAWELVGRYDYLDVGNEVFTRGFADPNLWTNSISMTDLGMNWHLNQYVKMYFDWQHSIFGDPVQFAPGRLQKTSDLFWVRLQLYF